MWKSVVLVTAISCRHVVVALGLLTKEEVLSANCGIDSAGPICFGAEQEQVILPPALPYGLEAYWSFDDESASDSSGHHLNAVAPVMAGPSFAGQGSSAHFYKKAPVLEIPGTEQLRLQEFTYTFWLHLLEDKVHEGLKLCPLLRKGRSLTEQELAEGQQSPPASPAVFLNRETRQLNIELATAGAGVDGPDHEAFDSNARLSRGRWFHIAIVRLNGQKRTRLYVNGILDVSHQSQGYTNPNAEPLYAGGDSAARCDVNMYMDELKVYNRPLTADEIQAEAAPALAGIEPSFVRLSCLSCSLEMAMNGCPSGYHICNERELHLGGYQVARTLGWLQRDLPVWSHNSVADQGAPVPAPAPSSSGSPAPGPAGTLGLGLCCADLDS
mmetsp:Transcript_152266/g.283697  ORF Transcript_152266/g.283697 Transcript_152266/m.283697 type:complete len:384 (+) Transcript_152266:36-1187(+)